MIGCLGPVLELGDVKVGDVNDSEPVFGRPPLVCGRVCTFCVGESIESGMGGGDIVIVGGSAGWTDFDLSFSFLEPLENSYNPAGSVETGR